MAIFKTIGLIKSYTLESNYNTGRYVNVLPPMGKNSSARNKNVVVPKYTPAIFEDVSDDSIPILVHCVRLISVFLFLKKKQVGRALGPSILDLTGKYK